MRAFRFALIACAILSLVGGVPGMTFAANLVTNGTFDYSGATNTNGHGNEWARFPTITGWNLHAAGTSTPLVMVPRSTCRFTTQATNTLHIHCGMRAMLPLGRAAPTRVGSLAMDTPVTSCRLTAIAPTGQTLTRQSPA